MSRLRRSAQTALFRILRDTLRPDGADPAVHDGRSLGGHARLSRTKRNPSISSASRISARRGFEPRRQKEWDDLIGLREKVMKELESARERKLIGNALEAQVRLAVPGAPWRRSSGNIGTSCAPCSSFRMSSWRRLRRGELGIAVAKAPGEQMPALLELFDLLSGRALPIPDFCPRCEDVVNEAGRMKRHAPYLALIAGLVAVDQVTKAIVAEVRSRLSARSGHSRLFRHLPHP